MNSLYFTISHDEKQYQAIVFQAADLQGRRAALIVLCVEGVEMGTLLLSVPPPAIKTLLKWEMLDDEQFLEAAKERFLARKLIGKAVDPRVAFDVLT